ncbi:endonuclease [Riemerella columbina]|uniref:endonuclease n=1 Tax=Riemerella columbina TaxID=103810 RepID=UPI00266E9910|nr:endonuclease [Riemerella columbina]WKS95877.1 endonuclease [Riemerella columbina]
MKKINYLLALMFGALALAQGPDGYYEGTDNLSGFNLKTKLSEIITQGHRDKGYGGLWTVYKTSDLDRYYENDNSILDIYSENPAGKDAYFYEPGDKQCGNYNKESDCYNREHIVPQSLFNKKSPMRNDPHFIVPTDGYVNAKRGDFPFGEVGNATWTSKNGSKLGKNKTPGFGGTVFEPIDEFKGDVARMIFYFVTRYEKEMPALKFKSGDILDPYEKRGITNWELQVLLKWHQNDPVSPREIDRNNAIYAFQFNRNPYIDHPEWVEKIWGKSSLPTDEVAVESKTQILVYPNPTKNGMIFIKNWKDYSKIDVFNVNGQKVLSQPSAEQIHVNLPKGVYILKADQNSTKLIVE